MSEDDDLATIAYMFGYEKGKGTAQAVKDIIAERDRLREVSAQLIKALDGLLYDVCPNPEGGFSIELHQDAWNILKVARGEV